MTHYGYFMQDKYMITIKVNDEEKFWGVNPEYALYQVKSFIVESITNISDNTAKTGIKKYKVNNSYIERPTISYYKLKEVAFNQFLSLHYGNIESYFPNGISGINMTYHSNGQLYEKYFHNNLIINGEYISYHENGQLSTLCIYVNGKLHGKYVDYYFNGHIYIDCTYVDNKLEGTYKKYLPNGQLKEESIYVNGVKK